MRLTTHFHVVSRFRMSGFRPVFPHTVGYARKHVIGSRASFVTASVRSSIH